VSQTPLPAIPGPAMERAPMPPERQPLFGFFGCSILMHGGVVASGLAMTAVYAMIGSLVPQCREEPKFEVLEVSMVALPKSTTNVPDREARVKAASGQEKPTPEPPPVKESDLVIEQPKPEPDPGNAEEVRRQQIIEEARKRMLEDIENAPEGTQDRNATAVDGQEDLDMAVLGAGAQGDPEVAAWKAKVMNVIKPHFHPLATPAGTACIVNVRVDPATGRILESEVTTPSGLLHFDAAAERAVQDAGTLPLAPEKYRELFAKAGVGIRFIPP
jgi:outer membrane biosynthesis protein TonB